MKKMFILFFLILVGGAALFALMSGGVYNKMVSAEEAVKSAWAQVDNVYQRRLNLIPNLVETVKGYAAHESETLQKVVEARAKLAQTGTANLINDPQAMSEYQQGQTALSSAVGRLLVIVERYPELKADQNFLALQTQLEGTENRITVERMRYNEAVRNFNTMVRLFPNSIIASFTGFSKKTYFEADENAAAPPVVKF